MKQLSFSGQRGGRVGVWRGGRLFESLSRSVGEPERKGIPDSPTPRLPASLPSTCPSVHTSLRGLLACLLALLLLGCDEDFYPFVGEERPFTLWGYMDAGADTQKVRVFSIEARPGLDRAGPIDAVVTSTDLDTDEQRRWHDSEVVFEDGSVGHVFWSAFRAEHGHRYRLEVARSDGAVSRVEVTVPGPVEVEIDTETARTAIPVQILGTPPRLVKVEVEYNTWTVPAANPWPPGTPSGLSYNFPVAFSYTDRLDSIAGGWETEINMVTDFPGIQDAFERNCLANLLITIRRIEFRLLVATEDWDPPGGTFDPEVLAEPGTFSNVENGFGFFGGGFSVIERWVPPPNALRAAGFTFEAPCAFGAQDIPECQPHIEPCFERE